MSSLPVPKILPNNPTLAEELTYKLKINVTNKRAPQLKKFLQLPEVKNTEITTDYHLFIGQSGDIGYLSVPN